MNGEGRESKIYSFRFPKAGMEVVVARAKKQGWSVNDFVWRAIKHSAGIRVSDGVVQVRSHKKKVV